MGGMLMMLMLCCMMWIVYAEDIKGDDDTYGDNNDNDNVARCCPCCYVTFETPPIQKNSRFLGSPNKNFKNEPTTRAKQDTISTVFAALSQKRNSPNNQNKKLGKTHATKHRPVHENHANKPPKTKRHTPGGGKRTCHLIIQVSLYYCTMHSKHARKHRPTLSGTREALQAPTLRLHPESRMI